MDWTQYALFAITILGTVFAVYRTFREPDEDARVHIAVINQRLDTLSGSVDKIMTNHLPHMDAKINAIQKDLARNNVIMTEKFTQLFTIIDERFPKK